MIRTVTLRPGTLVASGCLTLLSVWQATDGAVFSAVVLVLLALANLGFGLWTARLKGAEAASQAVAITLSSEAGAAAGKQRHVRSVWLRILVFGWVAAVAGAFILPPMSLVLAATSLYSTLRYLRCGRVIRELEAAASKNERQQSDI